MLIERLLELNSKYPNDLDYTLLPKDGEAEYNLNSYTSGLLKAANLPEPNFTADNIAFGHAHAGREGREQ